MNHTVEPYKCVICHKENIVYEYDTEEVGTGDDRRDLKYNIKIHNGEFVLIDDTGFDFSKCECYINLVYHMRAVCDDCIKRNDNYKQLAWDVAIRALRSRLLEQTNKIDKALQMMEGRGR